MRHALSLTALMTALAIAGCAAPTPRVEQGVAFTTGNTTFDDFFAAVRDVRAEALAGASEDQGAYAALIKLLGLEAKARLALAIDESGLRARKLAERGVLLHLEIAPDARVVTVKGKGEIGLDAEALVKALEDAARTSLETRRRFAAVATRASDLERKRVDLRAQAPVAFRDDKQDKREDVIRELDAAQRVLADAGDAAGKVAGSAARFVVELAQSVETGAGVMMEPNRLARGRKPPLPPVTPIAVAPVAVAPPAPQAAAPPPAAKTGTAKGAPPPGPAAPPPKKKGKGGDDFEP